MKLAISYRVAIVLLFTIAFGCNSFAKEDPQMYLKETNYLNFSHSSIQKVLSDITNDSMTQKELAIAIHNFVRDEIIFGFSRPFYDMSASDVLAAKKGFCNNQSTLFAALLRGAGIPARHRFYSLSASVLSGIINPGTRYVDHAVVEVYLNDRWIPVDSYIVDSKHARAVQGQLTNQLGLGMRANASLSWDGETPSFSQFHPDFIEKEFGIFTDVGEFYATEDAPNNHFGMIEKLMFPLAIKSANERVNAIRQRVE